MEQIRDNISYFDKLDYRKTIHALMERCLYAKGTMNFGFEVNRLILAIETIFPGMDFKTPIQNKNDELRNIYFEKLDMLKNDIEIWNHPLKKGMKEEDFKDEYFNELFEFVRDLLARHRGLLFGMKNIPIGEANEY